MFKASKYNCDIITEIFFKIKGSIIEAYREKSFAFAFWGVFIFGSIFIGFLSRVYTVVMNFAHVPNIIRYPFGFLSLWSYIEVSYLVFSIIYVYRKSDLITIKNGRNIKIFLFIYVCSCAVLLKFSWYYSFLDLLGHLIYDLVTGSRSVMSFFYALGRN